MELVLYYSTGDARMKKQEMMMKSVLVRMGVKIRNVAPDQVLESVGYKDNLAGMGTTGLMLMVMAFVFMSLMIMIVSLTFMLMVVSL